MKLLKSLKTLNKLKKADIDSVSVKLQKMFTLQRQVMDEIDALNAQMEQEEKYSDTNDLTREAYGHFFNAALEKIHAKFRELEIIQRDIDEVREILQVLYAESKRYEISMERIQDDIDIEERRQEMKELDEIGLRKHLR